MRCLVWQMMKLPLLLDFGYGKNSNFAAVNNRYIRICGYYWLSAQLRCWASMMSLRKNR